MLIYSMSVAADGFIADREGAFGWTAPSYPPGTRDGRTGRMRKLIVWNVMTLDGYFEGPTAWDLDMHGTVWGDELEAFSRRGSSTNTASASLPWCWAQAIRCSSRAARAVISTFWRAVR